MLESGHAATSTELQRFRSRLAKKVLRDVSDASPETALSGAPSADATPEVKKVEDERCDQELGEGADELSEASSELSAALEARLEQLERWRTAAVTSEQPVLPVPDQPDDASAVDDISESSRLLDMMIDGDAQGATELGTPVESAAAVVSAVGRAVSEVAMSARRAQQGMRPGEASLRNSVLTDSGERSPVLMSPDERRAKVDFMLSRVDALVSSAQNEPAGLRMSELDGVLSEMEVQVRSVEASSSSPLDDNDKREISQLAQQILREQRLTCSHSPAHAGSLSPSEEERVKQQRRRERIESMRTRANDLLATQSHKDIITLIHSFLASRDV